MRIKCRLQAHTYQHKKSPIISILCFCTESVRLFQMGMVPITSLRLCNSLQTTAMSLTALLPPVIRWAVCP